MATRSINWGTTGCYSSFVGNGASAAEGDNSSFSYELVSYDDNSTNVGHRKLIMDLNNVFAATKIDVQSVRIQCNAYNNRSLLGQKGTAYFGVATESNIQILETHTKSIGQGSSNATSFDVTLDGSYFNDNFFTYSATGTKCMGVSIGSHNPSESWSMKHTFTDVSVEIEYIPYFTVVAACQNSGMGSVSDILGEYEDGTSITITATANSGYKFSHWLVNNTEYLTDSSGKLAGSTAVVVINNNASYTAVFKSVYVTYDSLFNFSYHSNSLENTDYITKDDIGFQVVGFVAPHLSLTAYSIEVTPNIEYVFEFDVEYISSNSIYSIEIYESDTVDGINSYITRNIYSNSNKITFTPAHPYLSFYVYNSNTDANIYYSNFRLYPSAYPYMSTTLEASQRYNEIVWNMPTPSREGYMFDGWNTKLDGSGITYTSNSSYPTEDTTLYSQWRQGYNFYIGNKQALKFYVGNGQVQAIYSGKTKL